MNLFSGWITHFVEGQGFEDLKFNKITLDDFEVLYGEIQQENVLSIRLDLDLK